MLNDVFVHKLSLAVKLPVSDEVRFPLTDMWYINSLVVIKAFLNYLGAFSRIGANRTIRGFYIITDQFFDDFPDPYLKGNKGESRPYFYCLKDEGGLYWVILTSNRMEKYQRIIDKRNANKKPTDFLHISKLDNGKINTFLIGDLFPVTEGYILQEYTFNGRHLRITSESLSNQIEKKAKIVLGLIRLGYSFSLTQSDALKIEATLLDRIVKPKEPKKAMWREHIMQNNNLVREFLRRHIFFLLGGACIIIIGAIFIAMRGEEPEIIRDGKVIYIAGENVNLYKPPEKEPPVYIVIHITGEVNAPGVFTLRKGARVNDALELAGGETAYADLNRVNLAAFLQDAMKIIIPAVGKDVDSVFVYSSAQTRGITSDGLININTATSAELQTISGIGSSIAQNIIDFREAHGNFSSIDELIHVPRIGSATLDRIRTSVTVK